jgi:DNA-binding response OmpR family regulator
VVGKPRVLVVEDNPDMNDFVSQCLSSHFEVVSAYDGRDGLQQALRLRPTLVVSDIMMPNMSGVEMIAEMRKRPELQSMPIMLLSAKADEELMVKLLDDGAQDFIVKPFSERELVVRVRNLVLAQQAREASIHANRAKDEFLAMLGHELRNPLSPILTALQLMRLRGEEGSERELTVIERQVSHLMRLVDDLTHRARPGRAQERARRDRRRRRQRDRDGQPAARATHARALGGGAAPRPAGRW